jgi:hypothetical protein
MDVHQAEHDGKPSAGSYDGGVTQLSPDLAERYGAAPRSRRPLLLALVGVLAVSGLAWVAWVMVFQSRPEVTSQLVGYHVRGEHAATATYTVVRRDAHVRASCLLQALADDHAVVGELEVPVTSGATSTRLTSTVRTERRAGAVQLVGCNTRDRPARQ